MSAATHPPLAVFAAVADYWRLATEPTDYKTHVLACMSAALAEGLFYNSETYPRVAALMSERYGYPDASVIGAGAKRSGDADVESSFGTHCYFARQRLRDEEKDRADKAATEGLKLGALPVLMFTDFKRCTNVALHSFSHTGKECRITFKRGRVAYETTCTATQLVHAIERAAERKARRAGVPA